MPYKCVVQNFFIKQKLLKNQILQLLCYVIFFDRPILHHYGVIVASQICSVSRKYCAVLRNRFLFLLYSFFNCPWAICTLLKMFPHFWNICIVLCLAIFTFCHIFIVYFLSFKVYPHFTKGFCPPHVYSPIANLLLTLFPYCK